MVQIIINGYNNIVTIYDQLKNKQLPQARWYAWAIALIMGLNFISPSYCMASSEMPQIDASLTGEQQPPAGGQGNHSPVAEGARGSRLGQGPAYAYARDVSAGVVATGVATGIHQAVTTIMDQQPGTEETGPSPLEAANARATRAEGRVAELEAEAIAARADATAARNELAAFKKSWVYRMCPGCFRAPSTSNGASNNL